MRRRLYPAEFKRKVLDLIEAGRSVTDVARDLGISGQAICTWRRQERIDHGLLPGLNSAEKEGLPAAKRRIAQLEIELRASRRRLSWCEGDFPQKPLRGGQGDGRRRHSNRATARAWTGRRAVSAIVR